MSQDRREFLERIATGAMAASFPASIDVLSAFRGAAPARAAFPEEFDLTWANRVASGGKYRAVFDVPEIDSGYGVWRASLWVKQYMETLKAGPRDCTPVLVLRHNGIALAMKQSFWDKYGIAKDKTVLHPITQQGTDRNPALLASSRNEVPADFDEVALDRYISRGNIALACNLAFDDMIDLVSKKDGTTGEASRTTALDGLLPGVLLQPSGVFAAIHAQDVGCKYIRAS